MTWRRAGALTGLVTALLVAPQPAAGQGAVRLSGQVESNAGVDSLRIGGRTSETITWGSRYAPSLDGFIWHPRFLQFSLSGTYADQDTTLPDGSLVVRQQDPYRLQLTFFPQATHSFGLRAFQSSTDNIFSTTAGDTVTITRTTGQEVDWTFRGTPVLPETFVGFKRETTASETPTDLSEETRTSLLLRARKSYERNQPTVSYLAEMLERTGTLDSGLVDGGGLSHELRYEDRVRMGDRTYLTPGARYRLADETQSAETNVALTGPLSATLDGSAALRYSFDEIQTAVTHTVSGNGTLTKRFSPTLTVTSGLLGSLVSGETPTWTGGGFGGLSATPFPHLQTAADYAFQLTGSDSATTVNHRAHLGGATTVVPRHRVTADYFLNVFDVGEDQPLFTSHSLGLTAASQAIPLTTLTAGVGADLQESAGRQRAGRASLEAAVNPVPFLTLRARGDADTRSTSGGDQAPTRETGYGIEGGVDATVVSWLTLGLSGRRGVRDVQREDKDGEFPSEAIRGLLSVNFAPLTLRMEGFVENEPINDFQRRGVRGSVGYKFRIWTIAVDFEQATVTTAGIDTGRQRVFFRITRPLDWSWPRR